MEQKELFNKACNSIASFDNKFVYRNKNYTSVFKDKTSEFLWKLPEYLLIVIIFFSSAFIGRLQSLFTFTESATLKLLISAIIILLMVIIVHNVIGRMIRKQLFIHNKVHFEDKGDYDWNSFGK